MVKMLIKELFVTKIVFHGLIQNILSNNYNKIIIYKFKTRLQIIIFIIPTLSLFDFKTHRVIKDLLCF